MLGGSAAHAASRGRRRYEARGGSQGEQGAGYDAGEREQEGKSRGLKGEKAGELGERDDQVADHVTGASGEHAGIIARPADTQRPEAARAPRRGGLIRACAVCRAGR